MILKYANIFPTNCWILFVKIRKL